MDWLRPILLIAGVLFMALLVWWERRRPHRARGDDRYSPQRVELQTRSEPQLHAAPEPAVERTAPQSPVEPVVTEWHVGAASGPEPEFAPARQTSDAASAGAAAEPPLIVDWPEEGTRRIVALRILPARHDRLAGRALRQALTASGFRHGAFGIFHLPGPDGRVVLSAASLVRPGMLDPATMDFQRFAGVNLFAVLPGPLSDDQALQRLGQVAMELAGRVEGQVQDESGAPFTASAIVAWRGRCLGAVNPASAGPAH
jgi:cell division protein ZipA